MEKCSIDNLILKSMTEKLKITADLDRQKKLYNSVAKQLPDKGKKLKENIDILEKALENLKIFDAESSESSCISETNIKKLKNQDNNCDISDKTEANANSSKIKEIKNVNKTNAKSSSLNEIEKNYVKTNAKSSSGKEMEKNSVKTNTNSLTQKKEEKKSNSSTADNKIITINEKKCISHKNSSEEEECSKTKETYFDNNSNDSGFNDESSKTFNILKIKATEGFTSFQKLSEKAEKSEPDPLKEVIQSPAFKTYRKPDALKTKYTEAKPLFQVDKLKKCSNSFYSTTNSLSFANEDTIKQMHGSLVIYPDNCEDVKQPKHLKVPLMEHQIKALSWLMWREDQIPSGGILADDMGLGKTLTMIALILKQREKHLKADSKQKPEEYITKGTLVVCLSSIVRQWESEIKKHCKRDSVTILLYHGPQREKDINHMKKFDVVITTYQTLLSERKSEKESGLFKLKWERVILDEAHTIKNHSSQTAGAVFSLRSFKKWSVTGTPIHNDFKDMYSLVKFLQFHPFDDLKKFKKLTDDRTEDYAERRNMLVKSILLRRTKTETDNSGKKLVDMVRKEVTITYIELSTDERKVYDDLYKKVTNIMRRVLDDSSKKFNNSSSLLVLLLRIQQCCCHLSLLGQETEEAVDDSLSDLSKGLAALDISISSSTDSILDLTFSEYENRSMYDKSVMSTKLFKLFEELDRIAEESNNNAKSVIVSQWVSMLKLVEHHLKLKKKIYHFIAGNVKSEERQTMADDFNFNADGCKIMLLSLKAGGVGLNLVGANHLFLLDLHWNPALEMQACDRIHRVGQKQDVFIHKFVCKNTIEERILSLQNSKNSMAQNVLTGAGKVKKGLSIDDFKMLFNVKV